MDSGSNMAELLRWADYPLSASNLPWKKRGPCIDAGWLVKSGAGVGRRTSWKRRWFKIVGRTLHYYTKTDSSHPLGTVSLDGGSVCECDAPEVNMRGFFFAFTPNISVQKYHERFARTITLKALTSRCRDEWIESMERCTLSPSKTVLLAAKSMGKVMGSATTNDITPWGNREEEEEEREEKKREVEEEKKREDKPKKKKKEEKKVQRRELQKQERKEKKRVRKSNGADATEATEAAVVRENVEEETKQETKQETKEEEIPGRTSRPRAYAEGVMGEHDEEETFDSEDGSSSSSEEEDEEVTRALRRARMRVQKRQRSKLRLKRKEKKREKKREEKSKKISVMAAAKAKR